MSNPPNAVENEAHNPEGGPTKQELRAQRKAAKASGKKDKNPEGVTAGVAPSAKKQQNPTSSSSQKPTRDDSSKQNQKQSSQQNQNQNQSRASKPAAARPTTGDSSSAHQNHNQNQSSSNSNSNSDSVLTSLPSLFGNVSVTSLRTSPSNHLVAGSSRRPKNPNQNPTNLNSYPSSSTSTTSASISIHPSILSLAVQLSTLSLTGANARAIAVLGALSDFIRDYRVPKGMVLSRDLVTKLSPQINHLVEARPLGTSVGNAIRYLKYEISVTKVDWTEEEVSHFAFLSCFSL